MAAANVDGVDRRADNLQFLAELGPSRLSAWLITDCSFTVLGPVRGARWSIARGYAVLFAPSAALRSGR
jgi:hypothetical protein